MSFDSIRQSDQRLADLNDDELRYAIRQNDDRLSDLTDQELDYALNNGYQHQIPAAKTTLRESISEGVDNAQKRGFEIAGNTQKLAGTLTDTFVDKPAEALANITGFNPGVWYDEQNGLQASWNMPTDKQTKIGEGLQNLSDQAIETDTGYKQLNTLDDFEADPGVGTFFNMMAENGIPVAMDAVASLFGMPLYAASEIQRLGDERAKNKGKDKADWQDIYEASPAAIINVTGDRLLANTILGRVGGAIKNTKGDSIADKAIKVAKAVGTAGAIGAGTEGVQEGIEYSETHRNTQAGFNDKDFWKNVRAGAYIGGGVGAGGRAITAPIEVSRQQTEIEQLDSDYSEALQKELDSIKTEMNAKSQDLNESKQRAEQGDELDKAEYESKKTRFEDDLKSANQKLNARVHEILNQNTKAGGNLLDGINKITGIDRQDKAQAERMQFNALDERINAKREADSQELADAEREVFADKFGLPMRKTETEAFTVDSKGTVSPTTDTLDILTSKDATNQYRNQIKVPGNDFRQDQKTFIDTSIKQDAPITANTELAEPMFGIEGGKGRIYSEKAGELDFNYRIVEAKDVNPQIETSDNQARDRKRIDSQAQIMQMADNLNPALLLDAPTMRDGAPVVTNDGKIIAGNGRAAAINQAYQLNKAGGYKQQVRQEAQRLGFNQEQIDAVKNPVIIRQLDRNDETGELAILSNEEGAASMSAMEQAAVDAKRIGDISGISITETGDLTNDSLIWAARKIVNETGIAKRGEMMSANGTISENGKARIRNAIIYKAYGDSPVLSNLLESRDDGFNNITKALSATASKVASIKDGIDAGDYYDAGIDKPLVDALGAFSSIKASGLSAEEALAQNDMFSEDPPETKAIVKVLFDNIRSANKIREFIDSYNEVLASKGSPNQFDLLGGEDVTTMEIIDYVTRTRQDAVSRAEPKTTAAQRGIGVDTEAGGQNQQNERQGKETDLGSNTQDEQSRVEPELLTGYTQADLDARDQQIADAEKAEQEAIERDAINTKADQFTLTGSDTYLDQAAVNGQEDMLGELDDATKELPTQKTNKTAQEAAQQTETKSARSKNALIYDSVIRTRSGRESTLFPSQIQKPRKEVGDTAYLRLIDKEKIAAYNWLALNAEMEANANGDTDAAQRFSLMDGRRMAGYEAAAAAEYAFGRKYFTELGDLVVDGKDNIKLSKSGKPFKTAKSAKISATFKETPNAEIVQVEGGFGVRSAENIDDKTTSQSKTEKNERQTSKPSPTYVSRPVLNANEIAQWAKEQGFKKTLSPDDMHVTIVYSRAPVAIDAVNNDINIIGGQRSVDPLGDEGAVVLKLESKQLQDEWKRARDAGASWDYESYQPHITITYDGNDIDTSSIKPFTGEIKLGSQVVEPLNEDAVDDYKEVESRSNQEKKSEKKQQSNDAAVTDYGTKIKQNQESIDDFGEKLGGARKDLSMSERVKANMSDEQFIISNPLSKIWPKVEIDKTEDKSMAAFSTLVRSEIPSKPRKGYKMDRWIEKVKQARQAVETFALNPEAFIEQSNKFGLSEIAKKYELLMNIDRADWGRIGRIRDFSKAYSYTDDGKKVPNPSIVVEVDGLGVRAEGATNISDVFSKVNEALKSKDGQGQDIKRMKFSVRTVRETGVTYIHKDGDPNHTHLMEFTGDDKVKQAFRAIDENQEELQQEWEKVKEKTNVKKTDIRSKENRERIGIDHRNGNDVTPEQYIEAFGFRGVEFGNWVKQGAGSKDRQGLLNASYDAFMDLANIIGVPPKALSLNGTLGIGMGSRGRGAKYAAHFEPDNIVINLTKTRGAGSLAHEWFHALDNYFSRMRDGSVYEARSGDKLNVTDTKHSYITFQPEPLYVHKTKHSTPITKARLHRLSLLTRGDYYNKENWKVDENHPTGVRPEVETAFAELVKVLDNSSMADRAKRVDGGKVGYWSRIIERAARSFENYVITKLKDSDANNDFLANVVTLEEFKRDTDRYPYLLDDEMADVSEAFDNVFNTIETKETDKGIALFSKEKYSGSGKIKPADLQAEVNAFIESLPGIKQYGLSIEILESPEQAFGEEAVAISSAERASGAYLAESKKMYLFNANISNKTQARRTLRHEILAHHGLNLYSVADKKSILQAVTETRNAPLFKKDWDRVDSLYTELNDEQKAEEIIASIAEEEPGITKRFIDAIVNKIIEVLKKIGFIKKGELIAKSQLRGLVNAMAEGIAKGAPQRTFPENGQQYSKQRKFDDTSEAQERFLGKIGKKNTSETAKERFNSVREKIGLKIKQGLVDKYAPLLELDQSIYGKDAIKDATQSSSWVLARMSEAGASALSVMLSGSRIKYNSNQKVINPAEDGSKGFLNDMSEMLGSSAELDRFLGWVAAKRSVKLLAEGREHLFTEEEIGAGLLLDKGMIGKQSRPEVYVKAFNKFKQYQNDVLDIATEAGLVSKADREVWEDQFYVPFYRVDEDAKGNQFGVSGGSLKPKEAYKKLKGGKQNLNDLLENTLLNWNHLLGNSLKNIATKQAIDNAVEAGVAEQTSDAMKGKQATHVYVDGQKLVYDINDQMVYDALTMLTHSGMNNFAMKAMRAFKRVFTNFTTASPQFIVANLIRDSLQAVAITDGSDYNIAKNLSKGAKKYGTGLGKGMSNDRARILAAGGSFSFGYIYGRNPDDIKYGIDKEVGKVIKTPGDAKEATSLIWRSMRATWDKYQSLNDMTENVNRMAIYDDIKEESGNELYAAFQSRDLMDFSAHGAWPAIRFLTDVVPFLNARLQGLDKIYRSGIKPTGNVLFDMFRHEGEKRSSVTDKQLAARFSAVTGALLMATLVLRAYNEDDEEYRKLEDWQKDTYWFINAGDGNAFFIPKPFEVGAIATVGERIFEQVLSDHPEVDQKLFWGRIGNMFSDTFSFDPTPQMFNPFLEVWGNKDKFTDRPIESTGMQRLSPERRYRESTSESAKFLSSHAGWLGGWQPSPVQLDHLINGYLGWVGATANGFLDTIIRASTGKESPAKEWYEYQPARRFYRNLDRPTYSKYGTMFYEYLRESNRIYADLRDMQKFGDDYKKALEENKNKIKYRKFLNRVQRKLSSINTEMKMIKRSDMPSELMRQKLDIQQTKKNNLQEMAVKKVIGD